MSKIGIILAFLISVAAAGGSYYLYQGWVEERTVRGSVEAKYDQVKEKMITIQSEKEQLSVKSEEYRTKAEAMQAQLENLQTEQKRIDSERASLEEQLKSHQTMVAELQKKMVELEKKAKDAQAACGVTPADLKANPFSAVSSATNTTASPVAVAAGAGTSQLVFKPVNSGANSLGMPMPTVESVKSSGEGTAEGAPVAVEGPAAPVAPASDTSAATTPESVQSASVAVLATTGPRILTVNRKFNFVVINQGLQEGLKMGDKLKVFKEDKECATVQIEKLYDKFSAATLVEEDPKQQVVEGDEIRKA